MKRIELGCAGHFICASDCRWRRHTRVGNYRISSVGDYVPKGESKRDSIGYQRFFETMVFRLEDGEEDKISEGCGCGVVSEYSELDMDGYNTAGEAQAGHEKMVRKWQRIAKKEQQEK